MRIGGIDPNTLPKEEFLVLPRGEEMIVFRATGVPNYDEFNALCPSPKVPMKLVKGSREPNLDDKDYKSLIAIYNTNRIGWLVVKSLEPSNIEWDTVKPDKPSSWKNWETDMQKNGFNQVECNRVTQLVFQANCLDEDKLNQARENFLRGQQPEPSESSGQSTEPETTLSGKPASV
jgi:hypothetical protein